MKNNFIFLFEDREELKENIRATLSMVGYLIIDSDQQSGLFINDPDIKPGLIICSAEKSGLVSSYLKMQSFGKDIPVIVLGEKHKRINIPEQYYFERLPVPFTRNDLVRKVNLMIGKQKLQRKQIPEPVIEPADDSDLDQVVTKLESLTLKEKKILSLIGKGKTSREIAEVLMLSQSTIDNHRANISRKLNVKGHNALVVFAIKLKSLEGV
jgi:DNA-binding CsgD family transcriptional regulator